MKKRLCALLLAAMLMSASACAPSTAGPFADVQDGDWYAPYVAVCLEEGVLDAAGEKNFSPDATLKLDELQVMLIRLYDRQHGGDGTVPPLPQDPMDYLQFLDADGNRVAGLEEVAEVYDWNGELWVEFKTKPAAEELTLQMAFPGDGMYLKTTGSYVPEQLQTEVEPNSPLDLLQGLGVLSEGQFAGVTEPGHYAFPVETETPAEVYAMTLSSYCFMVENGWFDDSWEEWYYPYTYYWNYREGNYLTESTPRALEDPDLSPSDAAWWEDLAIFLGWYCPELIPRVNAPAEKLDERYTDAQDQAIQGLLQGGILTKTGEEGSFDGQKPVTRGEAAAVIARALRPELRGGQGILEK